MADFTEIYFNVAQPRLKFFNISYHSALCAAANWTVRKVDLNCSESFEMWCCRRIDVISWTDGLENEDVLQKIAENKNRERREAQPGKAPIRDTKPTKCTQFFL